MITEIELITYSFKCTIDIDILYDILKSKNIIPVKKNTFKKGDSFKDNTLYIGVFAIPLEKKPKKFIPIIVDNLYNKKFFRISYPFLKDALLILDYSKYNILKNEKLKEYWEKVIYYPFGYHKFLEPNDNSVKVTNDIYIYGSICQSRINIYNNCIKNNLVIKWPYYTNKIYHEKNAIDDNLQKSKITLSILKYRNDCNDFHRLRHAICNKTLFVAEVTRDNEVNIFLKKYGLLSKNNEIYDNINTILNIYDNNIEKYNKIANDIYNEFKTKYNIVNYLDKVFELIHKMI